MNRTRSSRPKAGSALDQTRSSRPEAGSALDQPSRVVESEQTKYVKRVTKHHSDGAVSIYHYHRLTGKRIDGEPGTAEFRANYRAATRPPGETADPTIERLVEEFRRSPAFDRLSDHTRGDYNRHMKSIVQQFRKLPIEAFNDPRIKGEFLRFRDRLALASPRQADYMWSVARRLVQWAVDYGYIGYNHLTRPGKLYDVTRVDKRWSPAQVAAFMSVAPAPLQLAMLLALHTGQRQGDLLQLGWDNFDGEIIRITQSKTGVRVAIPCTQALRTELVAHRPTAIEGKPPRILMTVTGLPWKRYHFSDQWRTAKAAAGIEGLTFNDLRGTFITTLSEAGCTPQEISAISGHALEGRQHILDTYSARTLALARRAIAKLEKTWIADIRCTTASLHER